MNDQRRYWGKVRDRAIMAGIIVAVYLLVELVKWITR